MPFSVEFEPDKLINGDEKLNKIVSASTKQPHPTFKVTWLLP